MVTFLSFLAEKIAKNNEIPLEQTVVVVPNKRARRELLRELALHFTQSVFAPNILSVNEFVESLSSLKKIENDELLIRLFDIYKKKNAAKSDDFADFLAWAPLFLHDINEIDMHLADAKLVFSNLSDIKTLETSFGKENLTEMQRNYLLFYNQLADLYADFTTSLQTDNVGYEGMIYRDAAKLSFRKESTLEANNKFSENRCTLSSKTSRYIFAGFNAITPSELELLHYFYIHKKAELYFDIDTFYEEKYGAYIEEIRQKLRISEILKSNCFKEIPKQISCIGAPKRTAQVHQTIDILNKLEQEQGDLNNTVLVFADESIILPFVHAYNTEAANITMGYPLCATFAAQQLQQLIENEKQNNRLLKAMFDLKKQGFEFLQFLSFSLQTSISEKSNTEEANTYSLIINILDSISTFLAKFFPSASELDFAIVEYFLQEKMNATPLPFTGDAHEGLQIMGLLETRMLDFKNVIILTMNEGTLPKGKALSSMLLYDIRRHFGLSTHQRNDAIFGYHFFRLLQRAENVYLIYDNESTDTLAEKSRFIEQFEFEVKKQHLQEQIQISHSQFVRPFSFSQNETKISITKTAPIIENLKKLWYSPSSLNTYIQCPLKFYWRYVEKITAPKGFDESSESAIIGTVIHGILEEVFLALKRLPAQFSSILNHFKDNIDDGVVRALKKQPELEHENIYEGKLYLAYQVVRKSVLDYLEIIYSEWQVELFQVIGIEVPLVAELCVGENKMKISGRADRIEMRNNKVTIFDYKTGKVEGKSLKCKIEEIAEIFSDTKFSQLFQMLCYAYTYQHDKENALVQTAEIQCGIIAFQELYKQNEEYIFFAEIDKERILNEEVLNVFEEHLKRLFSLILDESNAFQQTEEVENCKYCDYKNICNK